QGGDAANGREGPQRVQRLRPDAVLLAIRMPDMDGLEAASHLQRCHPVPAIIFCTAYDEHALDAFKVHALDYLLKPVNREALAAALERVRQLAGRQSTALENAGGRQIGR